MEDHLAERLAKRASSSIQSAMSAAILVIVGIGWRMLFDAPSRREANEIVYIICGVGVFLTLPTSIYQGFVATCSRDAEVRQRAIMGMTIGAVLVAGIGAIIVFG
jgi:hypothetical protein